MDTNIKAQVKDLHDRYMPILRIWFSKNMHGHKLYAHFMNLERTLKGIIAVKDLEMLATLTACLDKFFPKEKFFPEPIVILDSDSDDDDVSKNDSTKEKNPSSFQVPIPQFELPPSFDGFLTPPPELSPSTSIQAQRSVAVKSTARTRPQLVANKQISIAEYKTKTTKLKPAAAYAKPGNSSNKVHISVPYKESTTPKINFDPKTEAIKLNGVRERVYAKLFLNNQNETENEVLEVPKSPSNEKIPISNRRKSCCAVLEEKIQLTNTKLRQKPKQLYLEPESSDKEETSEEDKSDFNQIPIQKSQSTKRRNYKRK